MSSFKHPIFIKEFALRTKMNYLKLERERLNNTDSKYLKLENDMEINMLEKTFYNNGFANDGIFEITQLINSLIGLLVFPQQEYYKTIFSNNSFERLPNLKMYIENKKYYNSDHKYLNTYREKKKENNRLYVLTDDEKVTPANILRHMRNSVCHERVMIYPEALNGSKDIQVLNFRDEGKCRLYYDRKVEIEEEFQISIMVEDLKDILFEISDYILSTNKN